MAADYYDILQTRDYFIFNRAFIKSGLCELDEACVIQDLINRGYQNEQNGRVKNGWFLCTSKFLEKNLGIKRRSQDRIIKKLVKKGLIKTQNKGAPPRRYIRINFELILRIIAPKCTIQNVQDGDFLLHQNVHFHNRKKNRKKENRMSQVASDIATDCFLASPLDEEPKKTNSPSKFDDEMAHELYTIVVSAGCRNPKSKVNEWASHFRLLRKDGISKKLIRQVMDWYSYHIGQMYVPKVACGETFRAKWNDLALNMKRDQQKDNVETQQERELREEAEAREKWNNQ